MIPVSLLLANPGDSASNGSTAQDTQEEVERTEEAVENVQSDVNEIKKASKIASLGGAFKKGGGKTAAFLGTMAVGTWALLKPTRAKVISTSNPALLAIMITLGVVAYFITYIYGYNVFMANFFIAALAFIAVKGMTNVDFRFAVNHFVTVWFAISIVQLTFDTFISSTRNNLGLDLAIFVAAQIVYFFWLFYALIFQKFVYNGIVAAARFMLTILIVYILLATIATQPIIAEYNFRGETISLTEGRTLLYEAGINIWNATVMGAERAQNRTENVFRYATGSYEEDVDRNAAIRTLGLKITEVYLSHQDGTYFQGDPISAWGVMESRTLDRPITVNTSCYVDRKLGTTRKKEGSITNPTFTIQDLDYRDIMCSFPRHTFTQPQNHMLELVAEFEFSTNSYLRRYFIRQEEMTNLRTSNVDPARFFNIPREDENGRYTNGPIELSVLKPNLLQPLEQGTQFVIGYRIDNNRRMGWTQGKLLDIKNLFISIPQGFTVERTADGQLACSLPFEEYSSEQCLADCLEVGKGDRCFSDCSGQTMFKLVAEEFSKAEEHGTTFIQMPLIMTCSVTTQNVQAVFDRSQIAIKNFRASADYTFQISSERPFRIVAREGYVNPQALSDICGFKTQHNNTQITGNPQAIANAARNIIADPRQQQVATATPVNETNTTSTPSQEPIISNQIITQKAEPFICAEIIKAIIAFRNNVATSANNIGYTGIRREQLEEIGASTTENYQETFNDITHTARYLRNKLDNDPRCTVNGEKIIDCALGQLLCDSTNNQCAQTQVPIIIQLARYYGQ
jgi:hypothetical protein